ncbi:hypothetical protein KIW84_012986, partial [Lathyrus oleraceus]
TMDDLKPVTHLFAVDITLASGIKLLRQGFNYLIEWSKDARVGLLFSGNHTTNLFSLLFVKVFEITTSSYSHKKNALNFLDQVSSVYQQKYILTSLVGVDGTQAFIDEICKLAESNGLPSESFRSSLSEFSADEVRSHLSEAEKFLSTALGSESGVNAIFTNGR